MKVLVTGGCGNVGISTLEALLGIRAKVSVFDIETPANKNKIRKFTKHLEKIYWGDIGNYNAVLNAVSGHDVVIHLAAILFPYSEKNVKLSQKVNVEGTKNIVNVIKESGNNTKLVFASSNSMV